MTRFHRFFAAIIATGSLLVSVAIQASGKPFTILHTNDWQSRLLGFGPNTEYTPNTLNDDLTMGGVARLATRIDELRQQNSNGPVLLLDGGDISQGSLFHTLYREQAFELRLMKQLGYDALTLGNHEFDFRTDGLSQMLASASKHLDELPPIVTSNLEIAPAQKHLVEQGVIRRWMIIEKDGIRFGLFGLIGKEADEVTPQARPSTFSDQVETARKMVKLLREEQKADVVILMSHSGVIKMEDGSWGGEEVEYARQVEGIDAIVGGHSHTPLHEPIMVNGTAVVQAGSETRYVGELKLRLNDNGQVNVDGYTLHAIDDKTLGKQQISQKVEGFKALISDSVLADTGYQFSQTLVHTPATLTRDYDEQALGNLVADAIRKATNSDIAITTNGVIRDDILKGESGFQAVSDIFRLQPLGVGPTDSKPGYPLIQVWLTASEIRGMLEIMSTAWTVKGEAYFPRFSGLRFTYNALRPPLDRITRIELGSSKEGYTELDLSDDQRLYSLGASSFVGGFAWVVSEMSYGLISVTPKDKQGQPLTDLNKALVDADLSTPGVQELKNWQAQLDFFASLPDTDGDGIANITLDEQTTESRMNAIVSLHPADLLRNATGILWTVTGILLAVLAIILFGVRRMIRRK
ncbi:bifunctional metallophosphatase/5'-nucleotidase [Parendozoicomonas haliclonae]|uniref:Trifunctional nucleotide phosphoesterase protein YfkN n=1 Tax=Parendozoicomonas haliclonae TaxID=1960125 RepID=A0A1X7AE20_9GAMM|nr:5'-nucleotidase C-terminal domain-containing protein [Parendozoicomonas haliclonae]SMA32167.1 Trifunctional nucleotide phosphoesterase protein YfkN precursor [Parendozoicomonas haliclonae]